MTSPARFGRLLRLRVRLRERATAEVAGHAARLAALDRSLATTRAAEERARIVAATDADTGATLALMWSYADALARRAMGLLDDRARTITSAEGARETLRERHREEQQLATLAARHHARIHARAARDAERRLDELALWAHGRKR